jgi:glycosyltransferase involved in cell wall biosynthesis
VSAHAFAYGGRTGGPKRWRVGVLTPFLYPGGAEHATLDILKCLDPARFQVVGTAVATTALRSDMMVRQYEQLGPVVYTREDAVRLISECDIVLCWGLDVGPFLPSTGRRPAVVMVSHSTLDMHYAVEMHARSSPTVDQFVAVSRAALSSIPRDRRAQTLVIPHSVDPKRVTASRTRDEALRSWGIDPQLTVIGFLGRLAPEKRPWLFVDAIAELPDGHVGVMVGTGLIVEQVQARARRVAPNRIFFPGPVTAVGDALGAIDRLVHLASYESFGLALAEAMAAGLPVVSTPVGLLAEHGQAARLVPLDADGREIAAIILRDLADRDGTAHRAECARRLVAEKFDRDTYRRSWDSLLAGTVRARSLGWVAGTSTAYQDEAELAPNSDCCPSPAPGPAWRAWTSGVTAVVRVSRSTGSLERQVAAIRQQTVPPAEIWAVATGPAIPDPDGFGSLGLDRIIVEGTSDWPALPYAVAQAAPTEYVCVFDGGVVPGRRWFENCLTTMRRSCGILGTIGHTFTGPLPGNGAPYPSSLYPSDQVLEVDFVRRARFLRPCWLSALFAEPPTYPAAGVDVVLGARAWRLLGVRCFIPRQPAAEPDLWGCCTDGDAVGIIQCDNDLNAEVINIDPAEVVCGWEPLVRRPIWELFRNHARDPRNRGALSGRVLTGKSGGLALYLKPARLPSGMIVIEQAGFESTAGEMVDAYASWLTEQLTGAPVSQARGLDADNVLRGLGPGPGRVELGSGSCPAPGVVADAGIDAAEVVAAALKDALSRL